MTAAWELGKYGVAFVLQFLMDSDSRGVVAIERQQFQAREELLQFRLGFGLTGSYGSYNLIPLRSAALYEPSACELLRLGFY